MPCRRVGQRKLRGIVGLAKRYPRRLIDHACAQPLRENVVNYKPIQNLTERLLAAALADIDAPLQGELDLTQQHPLIRDGDDYADLFTLGAQTSAPQGVPPMSMNMIEIERALRALRLPGIRAALETRVLQAQANQEPFLDTFSLILQDELDRRGRTASTSEKWISGERSIWSKPSV